MPAVWGNFSQPQKPHCHTCGRDGVPLLPFGAEERVNIGEVSGARGTDDQRPMLEREGGALRGGKAEKVPSTDKPQARGSCVYGYAVRHSVIRHSCRVLGYGSRRGRCLSSTGSTLWTTAARGLRHLGAEWKSVVVGTDLMTSEF